MFHIIDDEKMLGDILVDMAEVFGYQATAFASPVQYIRYLKSDAYIKPVAIITDIRMPEINGYELIKYVAQVHPDMNFVVMSGQTNNIEHSHSDKACMYLRKPFGMHIFKEMLDKLTKCARDGASADICCARFDDRNSFGVTDCTCPKQCNQKQPHQSDASKTPPRLNITCH